MDPPERNGLVESVQERRLEAQAIFVLLDDLLLLLDGVLTSERGLEEALIRGVHRVDEPTKV